MEHFICEIIKPIKRRSSKTALNKNKSMNKVLSVHTTLEQCLYQFLRDGKCYNGQGPFACKEFKERANGVDLKQIATGLRDRLNGSMVLKYRGLAERNKITASTDTNEVLTRQIPFPSMDERRKRVSTAGVVSYIWFDPKTDKVTKTKRVKIETHRSKLKQVANSGGRVNNGATKSLCTKCGSWVQYPHDPKTLKVTCWLCVAKEVQEHETKNRPKNGATGQQKPKEKKSDGKRTSIPRRKPPGGRNP